MASSGGVEFSLVEPDLDQPIKDKKKMRDRTGNYDMIIWFQAHWDSLVWAIATKTGNLICVQTDLLCGVRIAYGIFNTFAYFNLNKTDNFNTECNSQNEVKVTTTRNLWFCFQRHSFISGPILKLYEKMFKFRISIKIELTSQFGSLMKLQTCKYSVKM